MPIHICQGGPDPSETIEIALVQRPEMMKFASGLTTSDGGAQSRPVFGFNRHRER